MALLTSCTETNKVTRSKTSWSEIYPYIVGSTGIGGIGEIKLAKITHTNETYDYVGLTEEAANTYLSENPSGVSKSGGVTTKTTVQIYRNGETPAFTVNVQSESVTDAVEVVE